MYRRVQDLIDNLHVIIKYSSELEADGAYLPKLNWIIINSKLDEHTQFETLLHELGHACQHHDCIELYNATVASHSKFEYEADKFMISELVEAYISANDIDITQINYVNFILDNDLDSSYIPVLQKILYTKSKNKNYISYQHLSKY
ncbi:ImmA/IrrE family metallo-endopeptidase [Ligilactobacillus murinus]|uniref:ImmA/IrrE family metallo-endopeptidase n=1 Tax=Ligilactobacillus murinus TaxID=1622 RepID=UPI001071E80E|nr:DUF6782 family putative metallopeptidase [Ligilactobacillus murinus]MBF0757374.1 ImmA/IrrE family metallo-endopeptidase [Ligilactobacillus murinus]MBF0832838.1 ImmA/IrrE family metallo-endopeptidase [Ligilactobacillus murinus]TFU66532.1 ImmA/IrrE family metallo-endopeptidase [Ligilactobacillus murinus]